MKLPGDLPDGVLDTLLGRYGLILEPVAAGSPIPGSYWGDSEAGLIGEHLFARPDTPLHSVLHEGCHYVCMDAERRAALHTDAAGGYDEENGVCYLQVLLAAELPGVGRQAMFTDMDAWGYSFRLGSSRAWFERDADDARLWLRGHGIIGVDGLPSWRLRG